MRKSILAVAAVAALLVAAGAVLAADNPTPPAPGKGEVAKHRAAAIAEKLGLAPEQRDQVKAIMKAAREQAASATGREAKIEILREAWQKVKTTILTEDQRQKLPEVRGEVGEMVRERLHRMAEKLGLSEDQRKAAHEILKAAHEQARSAADRQAKVRIFKDAFKKIETTVLNDDQRKKLEETKAQWKGRRPKAPEAGPGAQK